MGTYTEYKTVDGITYSRERTEYRDHYEGPWSEWVVTTTAASRSPFKDAPKQAARTYTYAEAAALVQRMKQ